MSLMLENRKQLLSLIIEHVVLAAISPKAIK